MNPGAGLAAEILNFWLPFRKLCYVGLLLLFLETFVNFAPGRCRGVGPRRSTLGCIKTGLAHIPWAPRPFAARKFQNSLYP